MTTIERKSRFKVRVDRWAKQLRVRPKQLRIVKMRRKWASCSTAGRLTFNVALLRRPAGFQDEVIVHELLHLRLPHHGRLFKSLLRAHIAAGNGIKTMKAEKLKRLRAAGWKSGSVEEFLGHNERS